MADSLVDLVMGVIDPDVVTKLAGGIGMDPTTTQNVVNSAIPGILSSIAGAASSAEGAQRVSAAVGSMDMSVMDRIGGAAGTSAQSAIAAEGSRLLGSLIGEGKVDAIAGSVAGANGTSPAAVKSVLGYLTPAIMGVIGQQDPSTWADGASIGNMFSAQRGMIQAALPAGLAAAVGGAAAMAGGIGKTATSMAGNVAANIPRAPSIPPMQPASSDTSEGGGLPWLWIIVGLVILGALAWYFTRSSAPKVAEKPAVVAVAPAPAPAVVPAAPAAPAAVPVMDVASLGKQVSAALDGAKTSLGSITDAASATAALPKLKDSSDQIDKLSGLAAAMPADTRKMLASAIAPAQNELNAQIDKVLAIPGVGDIVKGPVEAMRGKLKALMGG